METSGHSSSLQTPESNKGENLGDSGYEGLQTTPRYFQQRVIRKTRLEFSAEKQKKRVGQITQLYRQLLPYSIPTILIFSILFGSLMGRSSEERDNLKWAHILHLSVVTCLIVRYGSIQFGLANSPPALEIFSSDTGESLGGKRAAIQFYHDRINSHNYQPGDSGD